MKDILDKLSGYKTHAFVALGFGWAIAYIKVLALKDFCAKEDAVSVFLGLMALGGMSLRSAIAKTQDSHDELHDKVDKLLPPKTP